MDLPSDNSPTHDGTQATMDPAASLGTRPRLNRWALGVTAAAWVVLFVLVAVRYVNTGRMSRESLFIVLTGTSCLLSVVSHGPRRRAHRWVLRSCGIAALGGAIYVFLQGPG